MKPIFVLLALATMAVAGCQTTDTNPTPASQNQPYSPNATTPSTLPPSPNTINNPTPSTGPMGAPPP